MTNNPIKIIEKDHKMVEALFKEYEDLDEDAYAFKRSIADQIIESLTAHTEMEETLCYPRFKDALNQKDDKLVDEAYVEHEGAKNLLEKLESLDPEEPSFDATMTVLMEQVRHHVKEEEDELLPTVEDELSEEELERMGAEMQAFKDERGMVE